MSKKNNRQLNKKEEIFVSNLLKDLGIPAHLLGYSYIKTAIALIRSDNSYMRNISKRLYPDIAKEHESTCIRVERAIRKAIETGFSRSLNELFRSSCDPDKGKPTNIEFLAVVVEYFNLHYDSENLEN